MELIPTWDLIIIVFFVIIMAYSLIIGRGQTLKVILATYVSLLAADGIGNLIVRFLIGPDASFQIFSIQPSQYGVVMLKLIIMLVMVVLLVLRGGYEAAEPDAGGPFLNSFSSVLLGFLSAGLIVSGILVYLSGGSFLPNIGFEPTTLAVSIYNSSQLAQILIDNSSVWFSLPALGFVLIGLMSE